VVSKNLITLHYLIVDKKAKNMNLVAGFYVSGKFLMYIKDFET